MDYTIIHTLIAIIVVVLVVSGIFLLYRRDPVWEYGICGPNMKHARRHRRKGNVQFILWKAGQHEHTEDFWYDFDQSWWDTFISTDV